MKSDYILRLIEQAAAAMAQVAGLKKSGQAAQAQERLDAAFTQLTGMSRKLAERLDAPSLRAMMHSKPGGDERTQVMARLLLAQADLIGGTAEAENLRRKARQLESLQS